MSLPICVYVHLCVCECVSVCVSLCVCVSVHVWLYRLLGRQEWCLRASISVKRYHDHSNSYKRKHFIMEASLQFRGLVHYCPGRKQGSRRDNGAGAGAESSYILIQRRQEVNVECGLNMHETSKPIFIVTSSNKATLRNSAIPYELRG